MQNIHTSPASTLNKGKLIPWHSGTHFTLYVWWGYKNHLIPIKSWEYFLTRNFTHGWLGPLLVPVFESVLCAWIYRRRQGGRKGSCARPRHEVVPWDILAQTRCHLLIKILVAWNPGDCAIFVVFEPGLGGLVSFPASISSWSEFMQVCEDHNKNTIPNQRETNIYQMIQCKLYRSG